MKSSLSLLLQKVTDSVGQQVAYVNEDFGQLEALKNGETEYPVVFPCVLVSISEVEWKQVKNLQSQHGRAVVSVKLAFDCTSLEEVQIENAIEAAENRLNLLEQLTTALDGCIIEEERSTILLRHSSSQSFCPGNVKVYETNYSCLI